MPVGVERWAMAALLGQARRLSNERHRAEHRDRGTAKNIRNDLQGAFTELFLYAELIALREAYEASVEDARAYMQRHLYTPDGGGNALDADLSFVDDASTLPIGIDAKSFDCEPRKRRFAINRAKHEKLRGRCEQYYCLIVPTYGRGAVVCAPVPYGEVSGWTAEQLGPYGDPSLNLPIEEFVERFAPGTDIASLARHTYSSEEIRASLRDKRVRERLEAELPTLKRAL